MQPVQAVGHPRGFHCRAGEMASEAWGLLGSGPHAGPQPQMHTQTDSGPLPALAYGPQGLRGTEILIHLSFLLNSSRAGELGVWPEPVRDPDLRRNKKTCLRAIHHPCTQESTCAHAHLGQACRLTCALAPGCASTVSGLQPPPPPTSLGPAALVPAGSRTPSPQSCR